MSPKGPLAHLRTELGFELHRLPIGEFEALERPEDVLELAADGIIEHFEEEGAGRPTEAGPAALSGVRAVVFICR